jgi:colanic acid biosynthesis glycosyl transferase WcaI
MHVLLLSLVFRPDNVSTAHIMADIAADLASAGHRVSVFTTTPHYNRDPPAEVTQRLRWCWGPLLQVSDYQGMRVYHVWMPRKGGSVFLRLAAWIWFHLVSTGAALILAARPDVILAPSPPLTVGVSAWIVGCLRHAPFVYNVQEIYPDIAINLGALKGRRLIRALHALEQFVYRRAHAITAISCRMRERLLEKGVPAEKVVVIPNFVDTETLTPQPKDNAFSREYGVVDKFVVSYAGNVGPAQGLECFVDAAVLLRDLPDVRLMLVGDGSLAASLRERASALHLTNVVVVPHQSFSRVADIYGASDVCVVAQAAATGSDAIPSKAYRIMACERPIVAATERSSDLAQLVLDAEAGAVIPPGSGAALAATVRHAVEHADEWRARGRAARWYVASRYTRPMVSRQYADVLLASTRPSHVPDGDMLTGGRRTS